MKHDNNKNKLTWIISALCSLFSEQATTIIIKCLLTWVGQLA